MSNYSNWEKQFDGQIKIAVQASTAVFQEAGLALYKLIQSKTPVGDPTLWRWPAHTGYLPGTLKAAWTIDKTPTLITIANETPYAYRVEYGSWSTQAPAGMMRISAMEFPRILNETTKGSK